jgi:hypothetical protein
VIEFLVAVTVPFSEVAATLTPYWLLLSVLPVIVTLEFGPTPNELATLTAETAELTWLPIT